MYIDKKLRIYAFIDSQNLNLGIRSQGWKLDFKRFRIYLKDKYNIKKAFLFIGYIAKYKSLYDKLRVYGYTLVFKEISIGKDMKIKGNVDAELVLYASAKEFDNYDKAIIISGDGDFKCLLEYLEEKKKFGGLIVPNKKGYSKLLSIYKDNTDVLSKKLKNKIGE